MRSVSYCLGLSTSRCSSPRSPPSALGSSNCWHSFSTGHVTSPETRAQISFSSQPLSSSRSGGLSSRHREPTATQRVHLPAAGDHLNRAALGEFGGAEGDRTPDLMSAIHALSQLSYSPASGEQKRYAVAPPVATTGRTRARYAIRRTTGASPHRRSRRYSCRSSGTNACTTTSPRSIRTQRPEL